MDIELMIDCMNEMFEITKKQKHENQQQMTEQNERNQKKNPESSEPVEEWRSGGNRHYKIMLQ